MSGSSIASLSAVIRLSLCAAMSEVITLRALLSEPDIGTFEKEGVADVQVDTVDVRPRIDDLRRAIVLHSALGKLLTAVGYKPGSNLSDTIHKCESLQLISCAESMWCHSVRTAINDALEDFLE